MTSGLRDRLKSETRETHERLDALPSATALREGTLPADALVTYLRAMRTIWRSFEELLEAATDPRIEPFKQASLSRSELAARDLETLGSEGPQTCSLAEVRAHLLAHRIRRMDPARAGGLLGCLYTFRGSLLGGRLLGQGMVRGPGAYNKRDLTFFFGREEEASPEWARFVERLDGTSVSEGERQEAGEAALVVFEGIEAVMSVIHPVPDTTAWVPALELNPEAGTHRVTVEDDELDVALRAGERSWDAFPYYAARYGDRGLAFTRSDSAWLVTLARIPESRAIERVLWLGHVLAARGMPLLLLERHLQLLHDELVAHVSTATPGRYASLASAAKTLRDMRTRFMDDDGLAVADEHFTRSLPENERGRIPGAGTVLAAAVADDRGGVVGALDSVQAWFTDSERFSDAWVEAVHELLEWSAEQVGGRVTG
ncbi:MAG: biliverdin-producing heme oxygenase [Gemmatimonadota bacterium]|nr:biliverdin-producing heme oxygenase [Gemmatimonadota bacterium]